MPNKTERKKEARGSRKLRPPKEPKNSHLRFSSVEMQEIGRVLKKQRELLILAETAFPILCRMYNYY
jgi:hypothetical protein